MKIHAPVLVITAATVLFGGSLLVGCSKNNNPTNPYGSGGSVGGGGGGGGSTAFNSGSLTAPNVFVHTFPTTGTVHYHCTFHVSMGMVGTVTVVAGAPDSAVVSASGTSFTPAAVSVRPGGFVHWNVTAGTHTVTSD